MITSITLENYKSFGEPQVIPLEPITVIVGPNNCGKSGFLSLGRFLQEVVSVGAKQAIDAEGGENFVFHRPRPKDAPLKIGWDGEIGSYEAIVSAANWQLSEQLIHKQIGPLWTVQDGSLVSGQGIVGHVGVPFGGLRQLATQPERMNGNTNPRDFARRFLPIIEPIIKSRFVKLSLEALRKDAEVVPEPQLAEDGSGLAALLALWRGSEPEHSDALDEFLRSTLPEVKRALVRPAPKKSYQRLWIEQKDGESFDAPHLSDGILFFTALAMHALNVPPGAILFIEEPELCVHPRRLHNLVDFFRRLSRERKCQLVITTHSPVLLDQFRDEPEAIVLFQRSERGTHVKRLADLPDLAQALYKTEPGAMLANGFFNEPF